MNEKPVNPSSSSSSNSKNSAKRPTPPGRDYQFISGRKGPLGEERVYTSPVDEGRRLIKFRSVLHTFSADRSAVGTTLLGVLQSLYQAQGKDFSIVGTKINFQNIQLTIHFYEPPREISFRGKTRQGVAHNLSFVLRRQPLTGRINVIFSDQAVSPRTLFGLKDTVAKGIYKRNARYNARIIAKRLRADLKLVTPKPEV